VDLAADGLMTALREHAANVRTLFGVNCEFRYDEPVLIHDDAVATHLYRIAQEAVHNAVRHGRAQRIVIGMASSDGPPTLTVEDDGVGLPEDADTSRGMGLSIMNYRAQMIGAALIVRRRPSGGTIVECAVRSETATGSEV
jgi:signal transduction histidine kinase